jgi:hypothetical protein
MFPAGYAIETLSEHQLKKIDRLILGNPGSQNGSIERQAKEFGGGTAERIREVVRQATRRARQSLKVEVKWNEERGVSLLISNPISNDNSGWARIEFLMPFLPGSARPSFIITKRFQPALFSAIIEAFKQTWEESVPASLDN